MIAVRGPRLGKHPMKRVVAILVVAAVAGCTTTDYDNQFDRSFQQYRADAAAGRKGRAVARPAVVDGAAPADPASPAGDPAAPGNAVPPGAAPGVVPPAPQ